MMTTGRARSRAAVSLAAVASPLSLVTSTSTRCARSRVRSSSWCARVPGEQHFHVLGHRRLGGLHRTDEGSGVREVGEGREAQAARGEEDTAAQGREERGGLGGAAQCQRSSGPEVQPGWRIDHGRDSRGRGGARRVRRDGGGEGVGGVDHGVHPVLAQPPRQPVCPAEAPDADVPVERPRPGERAAREVVTRTPGRAASSAASRRASVVPPRTRTWGTWGRAYEVVSAAGAAPRPPPSPR